MSSNVLPTIDTGTLRLHTARAVFAADFTIPSIFSARFSAAVAAEFLRVFSVVAAAIAQKNGSGVPICVTTCRLRWRKPPLVRRKKSKFASWIHATNELAAVPNRARARSIVQPAEVGGR